MGSPDGGSQGPSQAAFPAIAETRFVSKPPFTGTEPTPDTQTVALRVSAIQNGSPKTDSGRTVTPEPGSPPGSWAAGETHLL
jgi:hypothetical protein